MSMPAQSMSYYNIHPIQQMAENTFETIGDTRFIKHKIRREAIVHARVHNLSALSEEHLPHHLQP